MQTGSTGNRQPIERNPGTARPRRRVGGAPGWWQASDDYWYPPETHPRIWSRWPGCKRWTLAAFDSPWLLGRSMIVLLALTATALTVGCVWSAIEYDHWPEGYTTTTGIVTRTIPISDDNTDSMIRFEDSDGFGYEFRSDYGGREGARVELSYDPFDPAGTAGTSSDREPVAAIALGLLAAVLWFASANGFVARRDYLVVLES